MLIDLLLPLVQLQVMYEKIVGVHDVSNIFASLEDDDRHITYKVRDSDVVI